MLSAKRVGAFLRTPDLDRFHDEINDTPHNTPHVPLTFKGSVAWSIPATAGLPDTSVPPQAIDFRLQDVNLTFPRGKLSLIAGKFGSGKTLLLLALMGEAHLLEGSISYVVSDIMDSDQKFSSGWPLLDKGVAYVPQVPWLQSQSIR